ncbi:MAG: sec-independent protein translocase protein TatC [Tenuifilum sp.]|jgi:sec-independent protein translocase protein TatC|uniref:twin-arginine translocase subunit TatC n=1 Tax=Tenuifilum sp. TaxID=2760880 RepID=UPI0024ABE3F9|nr:twin-arginine translocase subunit TatC [Tenuifilum sp.]MDI3527039.1 sec-independent protein translocase protein TatC [Tenuifilum sp.]
MAKRSEMTILEHLAELRIVLLKIFIAITLGSLVAFITGEHLLNLIIHVSSPQFITNRLLCNLSKSLNLTELCINSSQIGFINIELSGQFMLHIKIAIWGGITLAAPYSIKALMNYIMPALTKTEQKVSKLFLLSTIFLFVLGIVFGYFIIAPIAVHFLATYSVSSKILNHIAIQSFINTVVQTIFAMGIGFQLPLIVHLLTKWHLIDRKVLVRNRAIVFVIVLTLSAIITPPDVFSMIIVALPLWLLYELSIFVSKPTN